MTEEETNSNYCRMQHSRGRCKRQKASVRLVNTIGPSAAHRTVASRSVDGGVPGFAAYNGFGRPTFDL